MFGPEVAVSVWGVDVGEVALLPGEADAVERAVEKRRVEFARGRSCARSALVAAGGESVAIPVGQNREPLFPSGFVGSITHCEGFVSAVVGKVKSGGGPTLLGLGLDAEAVTRLEDDVRDMILTDFDVESREVAERGGGHWASVVFSAKEAVFKAVFPSTGVWLGFEDVGLMVEADDQVLRGDGSGPDRTASTGSFSVGWSASTVDAPELGRLQGRWRVEDGLVLSACWVTAS